MLSIANLHVSINEKEIIKGLSLTVKPGEIHVILGPNGSGKSTLAYTLAGHPGYKVTSDEGQMVRDKGQVTSDKKKTVSNKVTEKQSNRETKIELFGYDLLQMTPDERAKAGLFLAFQNPQRLDGVGAMHFLRTAHKNLRPHDDLALYEFRQLVENEAKELGLKLDLLQRSVNDGFSGGERKRFEMLQLRLFKPKFAIIDEIDSGLDVDALRSVALAIQSSVNEWRMGAIVITHYQRLLKYLSPSAVHIMVEGKIVKSGKEELIEEVEKEGYKKYQV